MKKYKKNEERERGETDLGRSWMSKLPPTCHSVIGTLNPSAGEARPFLVHKSTNCTCKRDTIIYAK